MDLSEPCFSHLDSGTPNPTSLQESSIPLPAGLLHPLLLNQQSPQTSPHPSWGHDEEHRRLLDSHNLIKSRPWVSPGNPLTCWLLTDPDPTRDWLAVGS